MNLTKKINLPTMRQSISVFVILAVFLSACSNMKTSSTCAVPTGRFVNTTVLDRCPKSMPADTPTFCFELNFKGKDSIDVDNGFEKYSLPYRATEDGCRFTIAGASLFGDMDFIIESDSSLQLIDTSWTKLKTFTTFKKTGNPEKATWKFEQYLNECIIAGEYAMFKNGELVPGVVTFLSNGQVNRLQPFIAYEICYAGDCLGETSPPANTINLIDDKGGIETYVFKIVEPKMQIELYSIGAPIPDIKGERPIGPLVYDFRTE